MKFYYWIFVIICAIFSFIFSMADMVYSLVDVNKLERITGKNEKRAKLAIKLSKDYEFSVSSILFGNNVVNIFLTSIVTIIGISLNPDNPSLGVTIATVILTVSLIIFCEFVPKAIGKRYALSLSLRLAYLITGIKYLFFVFVWPISKLFKLIGKLFSERSREEDVINEDVLTEMVDAIEEEGMLEEGEADLVRNTIDLGDIQAFEIMTPRVDVFAIDVNDDIEEILQKPDLFTYTRIPVYEDTIDNIIGVLPVKSLGNKIINGNKDINIRDLCYKPIIVPRNHQILDVLNEFKERKIHIAIVKDEYGGTEGILTMEDILEEIVGDIFDETDDVDREFVEEGEGTYIVDGNMNLDDFFELIGYSKEFETDYSTVAGFCQEILDRFAKMGDEFNFDRFHIKVLAADEFAVEKIKVIDLEFNKEKDE